MKRGTTVKYKDTKGLSRAYKILINVSNNYDIKPNIVESMVDKLEEVKTEELKGEICNGCY